MAASPSDRSGADVRLGLTKYGLREVIVATAAAAVLICLAAWLLAPAPWALAAVVAVVALLWLWFVAFFRDPERPIPQGDGLFVSPADGRVTDVTDVGSDSPLGRDGVKVGIFMSIFNVHVNRCPCDGRVERIERRNGGFLDARDPRASESNESVTIHIRHRHNGTEHPVVVRQIAGLIARRIVADVAEGQPLARGQRIGMVKFGSRLELLVPRELAGSVRVQLGRRVRAGQNVLIAADTKQP